jgi:hypothetical protein
MKFDKRQRGKKWVVEDTETGQVQSVQDTVDKANRQVQRLNFMESLAEEETKKEKSK